MSAIEKQLTERFFEEMGINPFFYETIMAKKDSISSWDIIGACFDADMSYDYDFRALTPIIEARTKNLKKIRYSKKFTDFFDKHIQDVYKYFLANTSRTEEIDPHKKISPHFLSRIGENLPKKTSQVKSSFFTVLAAFKKKKYLHIPTSSALTFLTLTGFLSSKEDYLALAKASMGDQNEFLRKAFLQMGVCLPDYGENWEEAVCTALHNRYKKRIQDVFASVRQMAEKAVLKNAPLLSEFVQQTGCSEEFSIALDAALNVAEKKDRILDYQTSEEDRTLFLCVNELMADKNFAATFASQVRGNYYPVVRMINVFAIVRNNEPLEALARLRLFDFFKNFPSKKYTSDTQKKLIDLCENNLKSIVQREFIAFNSIVISKKNAGQKFADTDFHEFAYGKEWGAFSERMKSNLVAEQGRRLRVVPQEPSPPPKPTGPDRGKGGK